MDIECDIDLTEFDRTFAKYYEYQTKNLVQVLNTKAYYIARNAVQETFHADKSAIDSEMYDKVEVTSKNGNKRTKKVLVNIFGDNNSRAGAIINARRKFSGKPPLEGNDLTAAISKMVAARKRASNFIRSGWIPCIKKLEALIDKNYKGNKTGNIDNMVRGQPKGIAIPATGRVADNPFVEISNLVLSKKQPPQVVKYLVAGMNAGIKREIASMEEYLTRKTQEAVDKAGLG